MTIRIRLRWITIGLMIVTAPCFFYFLFFWAPRYYIRLSRHREIVTALQSAHSIDLEEFNNGRVLKSRRLNAAQRAVLIGLVPAILPRGAQDSPWKCFVPHHKVVAKDRFGKEFALTICFGCNQAKHADSRVYDMPPAGSAAIRAFLEQNGIQVRTLEEYDGLESPMAREISTKMEATE